MHTQAQRHQLRPAETGRENAARLCNAIIDNIQNKIGKRLSIDSRDWPWMDNADWRKLVLYTLKMSVKLSAHVTLGAIYFTPPAQDRLTTLNIPLIQKAHVSTLSLDDILE